MFRMLLRLVSFAAAMSLPTLGYNADTVSMVRAAILVAIAVSFLFEIRQA